MQPDNKTNFINANWMNNNQVSTINDQYKKIVTHCEKYLNSYIKFLVPPQESCCQHLKRIFSLENFETEHAADTTVRLIEHDPECPEENLIRTQTAVLNSKPPTPKVCRFGAVTEIVPAYEPSTFLVDQPEPCRYAITSEVAPVHDQNVVLVEEKVTESGAKICKVKPFSGFKPLGKDAQNPFIFPSPLGSKPKVAFASIVTPSEKIVDDGFTPTSLGLPERFLPSPTKLKFISSSSMRPAYTTQVSTVSVKSNTVSLYSCWPPPISIILISIIEIILFFANEKQQTSNRYSHGNIADALMYDPYRRKEAWRFITYLFVHIGYQHLLFNLAIQVFLGVILEMVHQRWRVLTIYFAGVLAGSVGTSVFNPRVKLAGASGGVYSLLTAHIVTVILKWKNMQYPATQLLGFTIIFATDFLSGIYSFHMNRIEDIGYTAHFCGALAGMLVGFPILRKLSQKKRTRWVQYVGLVIYLVLILLGVTWNIVATEFFPKQEI